MMSRRLVPLAALFSVTACYGFRPVETTPRPGSRVRVALLSASSITTIGAAGVRDSSVGVLELSGTIEAAAADTVSIRLGELRTATGPLPTVVGTLALLPTVRVARIEERKIQPGRSAAAGIGIGLGAAWLLGGVIALVVLSSL